MPKERICPRCDAASSARARFCESCGLSLDEHDSHSLHRTELIDRRRTRDEFRYLIIGIMVVIAIAYFFMR